MLEPHLAIPHPVGPVTEHCPVIQIIAFTFLTKSTHFLEDINGGNVSMAGTQAWKGEIGNNKKNKTT